MQRCTIKLPKAKARITTVAQASIKAYRATKECDEGWIKYSTMTYLIEKNEVRSKVVIDFSSLNLTFLDVDSKKEDDEESARKV